MGMASALPSWSRMSGTKSRNLLRLVLVGLALAASLGIYAFAAWWVAPVTVRIAIPPGPPAVTEVLTAWARALDSQPSAAFKVALDPVRSSAEAYAALAKGTATLAAIRLDHETAGDVRSVAILARRFVVDGPGPRSEAQPQDADYLRQRLSRALPGNGQSLGLLDEQHLARNARKPANLFDRGRIAADDQTMAELWFLGTQTAAPEADDEEEEEPSADTAKAWRSTALALNYHLVAPESADPQRVYDITGTLYDALRGIRARLPSARSVTLAPIKEEQAVLRAHDGVARFVDREGQTFFERYGDMVYIVMALSGGLLTGLGALAALVHQRLRDGGRRHLRRLRLLMTRAHGARDRAELARVRSMGARLAARFASDLSEHRLHDRMAGAFSAMFTAFQFELLARSSELDRDMARGALDAAAPERKPARAYAAKEAAPTPFKRGDAA